MSLKELIKHLPCHDNLSRLSSDCEQIYSKINQFLLTLKDSRICQTVIPYRGHLALFLYVLWIIGCFYWFYQLVIIDVKPSMNWGMNIKDPRDAMVILFFGVIGLVFVCFFVLFIIKLIYNLFHDGIESLFPMQWHSLMKSISYLVILYFAFSFTGTIKATGLSAFYQVAELVNTSKQHGIIIEKDIPEDIEQKLLQLLKALEKGEEE